MVIVERDDVQALTGTGEDAEALKSQNWKSMVAPWTKEPIVPVSVSV